MTDEKQIRKEIKQDFEKRKEAYKRIVEMVEIMAEDWFNESMTDTAERLYNAGYRNCKDKVVLTKEEYERLTSRRYFLTPKRKLSPVEIILAERNNPFVVVPENMDIITIPSEYEIRKETATEIATKVKECKTIKELVELGYIVSYVDVCNEIDEIAKQYGVEIEE